MRKMTLCFLLFVSVILCAEAQTRLKVERDGSFSPSSQDNYNGTDPRVFVQNDIVARTKMSSLSSSQAILKPKLTGIISFQLKSQVDLDSFIQDYPVVIQWRSPFNLVDVKPVAHLNLTQLTDVKYFFALMSELKASEDVIWVEAGRADRRHRAK
ncbi:hypothetical protein [uncultured Shewanella sp.]|uniref:hypothetical protein n=1 Tax=uncultured Shewanella sp. TaxID=173975 RepID=UPI00261F9F60|nr:hypothetical protein [uncultured Shewanella sp.]